MAIMYPKDIDIFNPTKSERIMFNLFKIQLPDSYSVFYSVKWYTHENHKKKNSECDFLIFNPAYGYICIEVKGGKNIVVQDGKWTLQLPNKELRTLSCSPYEQAEKSMYFFKSYFEDEYSEFYNGVFGFAAAFPFYEIDENINSHSSKTLTIDYADTKNIYSKIKELYSYWRGNRPNKIMLSDSQRMKFLKLINKRVSLSIAAGSLIEYQNKLLDNINYTQERFLDFIDNYKQVYIEGYAGSGKSWIAYKKLVRFLNQGLNAVIIVPNSPLKEFYYRINPETPVFSYDEFTSKEQIVDSLIVDEGQDFTRKMASQLVSNLRYPYFLYVFLDLNQNLHDIEWKDNFSIKYPPFLLKKNIRNTSTIMQWTIEKTDMIDDLILSDIEGVIPEKINAIDHYFFMEKLENIINNLILKEGVNSQSITILSDKSLSKSVLRDREFISNLKITEDNINAKGFLRYAEIVNFKGLESDVVILLKHDHITVQHLYVAYTRAKFYLYEISINYLY
ncbi:NERD domain-containing protein [uncultured Ilyobacter sp.]|uniref:nuclease-related domain-containing DEAD/DEAH box helicase n=1 Tax=uncultured Ilyobacter sp. TaxID=544433 RepID=UPI002AA678BC|nr:NERD domain-containing protein [uncultured Ilyobacter sp.]